MKLISKKKNNKTYLINIFKDCRNWDHCTINKRFSLSLSTNNRINDSQIIQISSLFNKFVNENRKGRSFTRLNWFRKNGYSVLLRHEIIATRHQTVKLTSFRIYAWSRAFTGHQFSRLATFTLTHPLDKK